MYVGLRQRRELNPTSVIAGQILADRVILRFARCIRIVPDLDDLTDLDCYYAGAATCSDINPEVSCFMAGGVNFAIGPSCFVKCVGCYNHFGGTANRGGLVSAEEVLDFAEAGKPMGLTETTLSGGDPP
jgi:hypothetical protein